MLAVMFAGGLSTNVKSPFAKRDANFNFTPTLSLPHGAICTVTGIDYSMAQTVPKINILLHSP
jgi:hypothetical protein